MVPTLFVRTPTRPRSSKMSPSSSSVNKYGSAVGKHAQESAGTSRGRAPSRRCGHRGAAPCAISARAATGFGISCNMAMEATASTVSSRNGSCCASARRKPTCGPASARTARASIGSEMSTPSASPSGPAARASDAVTFPGPLPTSRATPPDGMFSHSIGNCKRGHHPARDHLCVVVEHRPDSRGPRRLNGAGVLRRRGLRGGTSLSRSR